MVTREWDYSWILRKNLFLYRALIAKFFPTRWDRSKRFSGLFSTLWITILFIFNFFLFEDISFETRASLINRKTYSNHDSSELKVQIYIKRIQIRFIVRVKRFDISYFSRYSVLTELRYIALYRNRYILPIVSETEAVLYTILPRDFGNEFIISAACSAVITTIIPDRVFEQKLFKQFDQRSLISIFYTIWREMFLGKQVNLHG